MNSCESCGLQCKSSIPFRTGKNHCRQCSQLICNDCLSPYKLHGKKKICLACEDIVFGDNHNNKHQLNDKQLQLYSQLDTMGFDSKLSIVSSLKYSNIDSAIQFISKIEQNEKQNKIVPTYVPEINYQLQQEKVINSNKQTHMNTNFDNIEYSIKTEESALSAAKLSITSDIMNVSSYGSTNENIVIKINTKTDPYIYTRKPLLPISLPPNRALPPPPIINLHRRSTLGGRSTGFVISNSNNSWQNRNIYYYNQPLPPIPSLPMSSTSYQTPTKSLNLHMHNKPPKPYKSYHYDTHKFLIDIVVEELKIGDRVDHSFSMNGFDVYLEAKILNKSKKGLQIHYDFDKENKYDEWCDYKDETYRYAKLGSVSRSIFQFILYHDYDKYFTLKQNINDTMVQKLKLCCTVIYEKILPFMKKQSNEKFIKYLDDMHFYLYTRFINNKLNQVAKSQFYNRFYNDFYKNILNQICIDNDTQQLQVDKNILLMNYNDDNNMLKNGDEIAQITLEWHNINDTGTYDSQTYCNENNAYECLAVKRCQYLLHIFQQNFIRLHVDVDVDNQFDNNIIDFVSLYNKCICVNNKYNIINSINDFHHIHKHHINDIYKLKHLITECENEVCIVEKRNDYIEKINNEKIEYFGYTMNEDINIIKLFVKYHIFLSHKQCLLGFIPYNINKTNVQEAKIRKLFNLRCVKSKQTQFNKFTTEVVINENDNENNDENENKNKMEFEFGETFYYYATYFETQYGDNFISAPTFDNLKSELLNNKIYHLPLHIFHSELINARNNVLSNNGKIMGASDLGGDNGDYGIPIGCPLSISQMLTVILYTNQTEMQYKYKKFGCRKLNKNDTIRDIAMRNKDIGHWYWLFVTTIVFYGARTSERDTFYHGLNVQLLFNRFNPIFHSPISTTADLIVASQFAEKGIILELKPDGDGSGDVGFNVSWLSNYPQEQEIIFAFAHQLYISDIRFINIENEIDLRKSQKSHLCALRLMDYIFNSNQTYNVNVMEEKYQIILIKYIEKYLNTINSNTYMDNVYYYINGFRDNSLIELYKFMYYQEYDSDSFLFDINDENNSIIMQYLKQNCNKTQLELLIILKAFEYYKIQIPNYLFKLFQEMINTLLNRMENGNDVFIIKSEYNKLNKNLQNKLITFDIYDKKIICNPFDFPISQIKCIKEYKWIMNHEIFIKFKNLKTGEKLCGPECKYEWDDSKDEVVFTTYIIRSSDSETGKSSYGISVKSMPSYITSLNVSWSFVFEGIFNGSEGFVELKQDDSSLYWACSNDIFHQLDCMSITTFLRVTLH